MLDEQAVRRGAHPSIGVAQGGDQGLRVIAIELGRRQGLGLLVLDAPDAGEVMVAVGTRGGVAGSVGRAAGVVVDGDLVVEIDQVDGPVGTDPAVNGAEPVVGAREELGLLAAVFLAALVGRALRVEELVVEELARGLAHEERIPLGGRPLGRPGAAVVDRRARGRGPGAHPVDLHVGLTLLLESRIDLVLLDDVEERLHAPDLPAGEDLLGDDHVADGLTAGGRGEEDLVVGRDLATPGVAAAGGDLLHGRSVGLEAVDPRGDVAEVLRSVTRLHPATGVAHRSVDPTVHAPAEVADDRVGVEGAPAGVEGLDLVGSAVAVRVADPKDVRGLRDDHAVLPEHERGGQLEAVGEEGALVGHAVAIGVLQDGDAVQRLARLLATDREGGGILGAVPVGLEVVLVHVATARVLGRLDHPQAALLVPVHGHDLLGHVLVGRERDLELGVHLEGLHRLGSRLRAAGGVLERGELLGLAELVGVGALARPGDAAQQDGPVVRRVERVVLVARDADESAVRGLALGQRLLVGPQLRPDVEDIDETLGKHVHVLGHVETVVDLVLPVEVGDALHDRVLGVDEIDPDVPFMPLGLLVAVPPPGAADDLLAPLVLVAADHTIMDDHHTTAARQEVLEAGALIAGDLHAVGGIDHQHVGRLELGRRREFHGTAGGDPAFGEELGPFAQEPRVVVLVGPMGLDAAADEHAQRGGLESDGERKQGPQRQEGSQELFHGFSQAAHTTDTVAGAHSVED